MVGLIDTPHPYLSQGSDPELDLFADDGDIDRASRSLKAMSHPLRLKILCTLGDREVSVQDIVDDVGTSQSNISCLLYTSPSPRDRTRSRMPSSA